ncbi:hypothetical protein RB653_007318 [Dictyostelium firmibasis]|uniref:Uncharacterized protein n=1 Tax=Dictyostelium firmibasis TaxID=79012 RepID=A0AAN7TUB7_9MYCE
MKTNNILLLFLVVLISINYTLAVVVSQQGGNIPNGSASNNRNKKDLQSAANDLQYANIFKNGAGTIANEGTVRIDMQGTFSSGGQKWHNLQGQLNGVKGKSTIAHVQVAENAMTDNKAQQNALVTMVINAMMDSYTSGKTYSVLDNGARNGL